MSPRHHSALVLCALLLCGVTASPLAAAARGGGGGGGRGGGGGGGHWGGGGGGGGHWGGGGGGGGAYRFSAPRAEAAPVERAAPMEAARSTDDRDRADSSADRNLNQGYRGSHPLYGDASRTAWTGHNMTAEQVRRYNQGGWNNHGGNGPGNNRANNFYNRNYGGWNNGWANGGYWGSRPWGYGWYNWNPGSWGWWGGASPGWGLAALASADVITTLVNDASAQQSTVIEVPDSDYQLNYATVDSVGTGGADFSYAVADSPPVKGAANCQEGLLDGQVPSTAAQAQLLNAACQVAYGPDPKGTPLPENPAERLPGWLRELLVLALGGGIATAGWQLWIRRGGGGGDNDHHAPVTSG